MEFTVSWERILSLFKKFTLMNTNGFGYFTNSKVVTWDWDCQHVCWPCCQYLMSVDWSFCRPPQSNWKCQLQIIPWHRSSRQFHDDRDCVLVVWLHWKWLTGDAIWHALYSIPRNYNRAIGLQNNIITMGQVPHAKIMCMLFMAPHRWAEPRPRPENGRTGDKPIRGFVPPPENRRHQSDCSKQGNTFLSLRLRLRNSIYMYLKVKIFITIT